MEGGGMTSNPKPEREKCPHDGHLLDRAGKCWYCGGIYPAGKPALTVVEAEPQVEVETVQTMTVDPETGGAMTNPLYIILPALAALLVLAWLLRPRETTELPWSIRLFEPDMTPEWHP